MDIKKILKYVGIIILIYFVISIIVIIINDKYKETESYKKNPENWVSKENNIISVKVENIPGGVAEYDGALQQFNDGDISTAFIIEGWYDGNYFKNFYSENEKVMVYISNELNSDDDVMDVFISEVFDNGQPYIDIFLDSKWKTLGKVNIWYGKDFENYEEFRFTKENEIKKGIFHNRIKDDLNRFIIGSDPLQSQGGLLLGDLHRDDWINKNPEGKIVIMFS